MNRHHGSGSRELLGAALDLVPPAIRDVLEFEVLTDTDPVFAGLHRYTDASYGRSYSNTWHVAYPLHQAHLPRARRATTVVLPTSGRCWADPVPYLVHELGHVLHERLRFEPDAVPVSEYGATDRWEAFAESFRAWLCPESMDVPARLDPATLHLLEGLAVR